MGYSATGHVRVSGATNPAEGGWRGFSSREGGIVRKIKPRENRIWIENNKFPGFGGQ